MSERLGKGITTEELEGVLEDPEGTLERMRMLERKFSGALDEIHEVDQVLGKALGFPWFKNDQENFPGATEADGVCTGEHTPVTLAMEASARIRDLEVLKEGLERHARSLEAEIKEKDFLIGKLEGIVKGFQEGGSSDAKDSD